MIISFFTFLEQAIGKQTNINKPLVKVSPNHRLIKYAWEIYVIDVYALFWCIYIPEASNFLLIYLILIYVCTFSPVYRLLKRDVGKATTSQVELRMCLIEVLVQCP